MYRSLPVGNRILNEKWNQKMHDRHRKRLDEVKADIDNAPPPAFNHLATRGKRDQMLEEKYKKIEHENRILLQKMSHIMTHNTLDNHCDRKPHSLNATARKKELQRIMEDNQKILHRIQARKPYYDKREWETHGKLHEQRVSQMAQVIVRPSGRSQALTSKKGGTDSKTAADYADGSGATSELLERLLLKEGRYVGDKYVILSVWEHPHPHVLSLRSYNLDTSDLERVDVPWNTLERLLMEAGISRADSDSTPSLLTDLPASREQLAQYMASQLQFSPKLSLPKNLKPLPSIAAAPAAAQVATLELPAIVGSAMDSVQSDANDDVDLDDVPAPVSAAQSQDVAPSIGLPSEAPVADTAQSSQAAPIEAANAPASIESDATAAPAPARA